jgi:transposase
VTPIRRSANLTNRSERRGLSRRFRNLRPRVAQNAIIADLDARGAKVVISQHPRRIPPLAIDLEMYKWRHLIENFFGKLKEFKRIALRADKTDQSFAAMLHLTAAVINSR